MTNIEFGRADLKLFIVTAFLHHHCPCNQRKRAMHLIPVLFLGLVVYSLQGMWRFERAQEWLILLSLDADMLLLFFFTQSYLAWPPMQPNETQSQRNVSSMFEPMVQLSHGEKVSCSIRKRVGKGSSGSSSIRRNNLWERLNDINLQLAALVMAVWDTFKDSKEVQNKFVLSVADLFLQCCLWDLLF